MASRDAERAEGLARKILDLGPSALSVIMVDLQNGSTLTELVRLGATERYGFTTKRNNGMAGRWAILAFNSMERLENIQSKERYLIMVNESYSRLFFQIRLTNDVLVGLTLQPETSTSGIFQQVREMLAESQISA